MTSPAAPTSVVATNVQWHFMGTVPPAAVSTGFAQPPMSTDTATTAAMAITPTTAKSIHARLPMSQPRFPIVFEHLLS